MADPKPIDLSELLSRYIFTKRHFKKDPPEVKAAAFSPWPYQDRFETSVFRVSGMDEPKIWEIGNTVARGGRPDSLKARADITVERALVDPLKIEPEPTSHEAHAVLIGWPSIDQDIDIIIAELALRSKLELPPRE